MFTTVFTTTKIIIVKTSNACCKPILATVRPDRWRHIREERRFPKETSIHQHTNDSGKYGRKKNQPYGRIDGWSVSSIILIVYAVQLLSLYLLLLLGSATPPS